MENVLNVNLYKESPPVLGASFCCDAAIQPENKLVRSSSTNDSSSYGATPMVAQDLDQSTVHVSKP